MQHSGKKTRNVSEIQTHAVTHDPINLAFQCCIEAYPLQVFPVINFTQEGITLRRYIEAANYLFVALIKALMAS